MEQKIKSYSQQLLEKINNREADSIEAYGELCFLEGKFVYAYTVEKERIQKELRQLAIEYNLTIITNPIKKK